MDRAVAKYFNLLSQYLRLATEALTSVQYFTERDADPEPPKHETEEPCTCPPKSQ